MERKITYMTDEEAAMFRQKLISEGIITPSTVQYQPGERPPMDRALVQAYKAKLITHGILKPNPFPQRKRPRLYN